MHALGQGTKQNNVFAYMWWDIAAAQAQKDAMKNIRLVKKQMTLEKITKAQELARQCVKKNYRGC